MAPTSDKQSLKQSSQLEAEAEARREGASTSHLGVYTVWSSGKVKQQKNKSLLDFVPVKSQILNFSRNCESLVYVVRFLKEIYSLSPVIVGLLFIVDAVQSTAPALTIYVTGRLLNIVCACVGYKFMPTESLFCLD
jgi:hypothetical protein